MSERHTVIVHMSQVQEYLDRGYRLEEQSAVDHMRGGVATSQMNETTLAELFTDQRVMSIDAIEKRKLDAPVQKYALREVEHIFVPNRYEVRKYDVIEDGVVADSGSDTGPEEIAPWELHDTPRQCVEASRAALLREVERLRQAADAILAFLKGHEAI